jgi:hypothetical protein
LNNHTVLFIPPQLRADLTDEAYQQNEVIFQEGGLTVLAAPWHYAFCSKLDRISGSTNLGQTKPYDLSDAIAYLLRYLEINRTRTVTAVQVHAWAANFRIRIGQGVLEMVNAEFQRAHGWAPIV